MKLLLAAALSILLFSCTMHVEKRRYRSGWNVQVNHPSLKKKKTVKRPTALVASIEQEVGRNTNALETQPALVSSPDHRTIRDRSAEKSVVSQRKKVRSADLQKKDAIAYDGISAAADSRASYANVKSLAATSTVSDNPYGAYQDRPWDLSRLIDSPWELVLYILVCLIIIAWVMFINPGYIYFFI